MPTKRCNKDFIFDQCHDLYLLPLIHESVISVGRAGLLNPSIVLPGYGPSHLPFGKNG
jgi:hypothetical protein